MRKLSVEVTLLNIFREVKKKKKRGSETRVYYDDGNSGGYKGGLYNELSNYRQEEQTKHTKISFTVQLDD